MCHIYNPSDNIIAFGYRSLTLYTVVINGVWLLEFDKDQLLTTKRKVKELSEASLTLKKL